MKHVLAKKKGKKTSIGIMQASTIKDAKDFLKQNNLNPKNYTYKIEKNITYKGDSLMDD
tara:strand:- start:2960 stop:3136 length:177 start_codon:yes stop_codon:yes gene_type:complete